RETSNVTVIWLVPSLPLDEEMYFIPCTPLMACSRGVVTADSTVWAFAPMNTLVTTTCGGARSGNCAIGSVGIEIAPARIISSAQTVANTGRRMKKSTNNREFRLGVEWVHVKWCSRHVDQGRYVNAQCCLCCRPPRLLVQAAAFARQRVRRPARTAN